MKYIICFFIIVLLIHTQKIIICLFCALYIKNSAILCAICSTIVFFLRLYL